MVEKYLHLLEQMVNIDSGSGDAAGLAQIGALIQKHASDLGFAYQTLAGTDGTEHYYMSRGKGRKLLLIAHLDTVFPKGTVAVRPFASEGQIARGPGVSDCKSGVVTILGALEQLKLRFEPAMEIGCLFNCDEELGSPGSRAIIEMLARDAYAVLVVEPAEEETITVARKGIGRFKLEVFGKAAHSGSNFLDGRSAIVEMAHQIIALHNLTDVANGITVNTGVIRGGTKSNVVPDYAVADIDLRIKELGQERGMIERLQQVTAVTRIAGVTTKLSGGITRPPMPGTQQNMQLYEIFKQAAAEQGIALGVCESGGGSDANFVAALGIPVIDGVGPIGGGHHSEDEYLDLESMVVRTDLLAKCLRRLME